ncbi:MAG: hypothetical protein JW950_10610 [Deltaproteobacteria bacterium]|nr:hypothetical protein [Deltaproteobacteria bacterium]
MKRRILAGAAAAVFLIVVVACTTYQRQVVPFKMPSAYPNAAEAAGAAIAAKAYDGVKEARDAFGFDIRNAGILPVQIIFDNKGGHPLEIVPERTLLADADGNLWPILDANLAYDRLAKETELGRVVPEGAKSGLLAGAAGALIGAAIGIVSGHNVGDAAMKGAAVGAAAGATLGGARGMSDVEVRGQIREDLQNRSLERRAIAPYEVAHGFVFFPGEAKKSQEIRLTLRALDTGEIYNVIMKF